MFHRLARAAIGARFVIMGYDAFRDPGPRTEMAASLGIPRPELAVRSNGLAMVAGGLGVVSQDFHRAAALGLIVSLVPTTVAGHPFWRDADPATRRNNTRQALKNLGLAGGLLAIAAGPPGRVPSVKRPAE